MIIIAVRLSDFQDLETCVILCDFIRIKEQLNILVFLFSLK